MCISLSFCLVSLRFSWRVRRSSRFVAKSGHQDGPMGRGTEHDTDTSSIYLNVQPPDERPHETNQYSISYPPERSKSQSRRGREPPVIIGDPTDASVLERESLRRTSSRASGRVEVTTSKSPRNSLRASDDNPTRNSFNLRNIPIIPQEDSDDILLTPTPRHSQLPSRPRSSPHTPTHPPARMGLNL